MSGLQDNNNKHLKLGKHLWMLYQNNAHTDLDIVVTTADNQTRQVFECHKIIMMRLSSTFENLIFLDQSSEGCVHINGVEPSVFEKIIRFAYTDHLQIDSSFEALRLYTVARTYGMKYLEKIALKSLEETLNVGCVWQVLDNINSVGKKALKDKILKKIDQILERQTAACLESPDFLACSQASLARLLRQEALSVESEVPLAEAAARWCQLRNFGVSLDGARARELLGPALPLLRFLSLDSAAFSQHVLPLGLLSQADSLAVLVRLTAPDNHQQLPPYIGADARQRQAPYIEAPSEAPMRRLPSMPNLPQQLIHATTSTLQWAPTRGRGSRGCYRGRRPTKL